MAALARRPFLDSIFARLIALVIAVACGVVLFFLYEDEVVVAESQTQFEQSAAAQCYAERAADIDQMLAEGMIGEEQAMLFKRREEARCATQAGSTAPAPATGE